VKLAKAVPAMRTVAFETSSQDADYSNDERRKMQIKFVVCNENLRPFVFKLNIPQTRAIFANE